MTPASFCAMGCDVVVAGASDAELVAIRDLFGERERRFSRFLSCSELARVNDACDARVVVSDDMAHMVRLALRAALVTGGLVDPTVGASVAALGYDRDIALLVDDPTPVDAAPAGRWRAVRVDGRVLERPVGVVLDLNGVVKGRTVDDALALLPGPGFVSAGGDLAVRGGANVALPSGGAVSVASGGIATSGTATRQWTRGGARRHHLVDAATGLSADVAWVCVTAAGPTCLAADVAAKAAFLRGDEGPGWLDAVGVPGRFVARDGRVVLNARWRDGAGPARDAA
jgi:thiamine biosynthesis lipoprotein